MKEVLKLIETKKRQFSQLALFKYMQDTSIDPRQRLAWAPCFAPVAMPFTDLLRNDFRREPANCELQEIINKHTYEDETHYIWFLDDLKRLGFNESQSFTDNLQFFWGSETEKTRQVCYRISHLIYKADPVTILAVIESIEATGHVIFSHSTPAAMELQKITKQPYVYFGQHHLSRETGHTMGTESIENLLDNLQITETQKIDAFNAVEQVFKVVTDCVNELLMYAQNHPVKQLIRLS
ncbi:hypothetical protein RIVM261_064510 [Rivularia sp. IAM M-261]|nr:hypothetical protein RIVM261_064510 [Rivularia sp. IAM M-261]